MGASHMVGVGEENPEQAEERAPEEGERAVLPRGRKVLSARVSERARGPTGEFQRSWKEEEEV